MDTPAARPIRTARRALAALPVAALGLALGASAVAAAGKDAKPAASPAAEPTPALTWAPLVTPPPIVDPGPVTPAALADGYALGAPDAPVTVEVWEDFQCPYCQRWGAEVKPLLTNAYILSGDVRLVFRTLSFLGEESRWAAVAADLAAEQNRFWAFHDLLFANLNGENRGSYGLDRLLAMGEAAGLEMDAFRAGLVLDAARARYAAIEQRELMDAGRVGVDRTPTLVVNGVKLASPDWPSLEAAIEAALGGDAAPSPAASPAG
ncbi:MAG: DsbA family protein [Chloroflexota bacterium]